MNYQEIIAKLEVDRLAILKKLTYCLIGTVVITLFSFLFGSQGPIFGILIGGVVTIIVVSSGISKYKATFKNNLMPLLIAKTGLELKYEYKSGISQNEVLQSKLFKKPDRYHCEDLMYGQIEGVTFLSSDVHMEERHVRYDSKGHAQTYYETTFFGRWFVYDFNKEFNGIIQVREDGFLAGPSWGLNLQKISLEDVEFNKKFKTYASQQHDAFYVLTPSLIENIKRLEGRYPGRIYFSFIGSQLHIAVYNSKNAFEPPIFSPLNDSFINMQVADIQILKEIVSELKLNRNIFKE